MGFNSGFKGLSRSVPFGRMGMFKVVRSRYSGLFC